VFAIGHHDWLNVFQEFDELSIEETLRDPQVITAVQAVNQASSGEERIGAIEGLMETLE
jgi:hypothetical protein